MSTILSVDDCAVTRSLISSSLEPEGYRVLAAVDGQEALALVDTAPIDLALVDLALPGMDGAELISVLRQAKPDIPIVVVSGTGELETVVRVMKLGAQDYIQKPVDFDRLRKVVEAALKP